MPSSPPEFLGSWPFLHLLLPSSLFYKTNWVFSEQFSVQKEIVWISTYPLARGLPHVQHPLPKGASAPAGESTSTHLPQSPPSTLGLALGVVHSVASHRCHGLCVRRGIRQSSFIALKVLF